MICSQCHSSVPDGAVQCPVCGKTLAEPKRTVCQYCGAELEEGQLFCGQCGANCFDPAPLQDRDPRNRRLKILDRVTLIIVTMLCLLSPVLLFAVDEWKTDIDIRLFIALVTPVYLIVSLCIILLVRVTTCIGDFKIWYEMQGTAALMGIIMIFYTVYCAVNVIDVDLYGSFGLLFMILFHVGEFGAYLKLKDHIKQIEDLKTANRVRRIRGLFLIAVLIHLAGSVYMAIM